MKPKKIVLRIESICEAIIYIWMIFYIEWEIFSFKYRLCGYACGCCDWNLLQTCKYSIWNNLSCYIYAG